MKKCFYLFLVLFITSSASSCISLSTLDNIKSYEDSRVERWAFTEPKEVLENGILDIAKGMNLKLVSQDATKGAIYFKSPIKPTKVFSPNYGLAKYIAVYIKPISPRATSVEIVQQIYFPVAGDTDFGRLIINKLKEKFDTSRVE